jgi:orotate phosphoribosyltransferase-like protein
MMSKFNDHFAMMIREHKKVLSLRELSDEYNLTQNQIKYLLYGKEIKEKPLASPTLLERISDMWNKIVKAI